MVPRKAKACFAILDKATPISATEDFNSSHATQSYSLKSQEILEEIERLRAQDQTIYSILDNYVTDNDLDGLKTGLQILK